MELKTLKLNGQSKLAAALDQFAELPAVWEAFGLASQRPVVVIVGGAGGMSDEDIQSVQTLFAQHLIPFVQEQQAVTIEGGTDAGVMRAIGRAYHQTGTTLPLISVAARGIEGVVDMLETHHTHFILCPGTEWGDESEWIAAAASALAGSAPSATLLFNGGQIAWRDADFSVKYKRPVLVADGSGRTADTLARTSQLKALDLRAVRLLRSGLIHIANPFKHPEVFMDKLRKLMKA